MATRYGQRIKEIRAAAVALCFAMPLFSQPLTAGAGLLAVTFAPGRHLLYLDGKVEARQGETNRLVDDLDRALPLESDAYETLVARLIQ